MPPDIHDVVSWALATARPLDALSRARQWAYHAGRAAFHAGTPATGEAWRRLDYRCSGARAGLQGAVAALVGIGHLTGCDP